MNLFDNFLENKVNKLFLDVKNAEVAEKTGPEAVERLEKVEHELCFQQLRWFQQFLPKIKLGLFVLQTLSTQGATEFSTLWGLLLPCAKIVCCTEVKQNQFWL